MEKIDVVLDAQAIHQDRGLCAWKFFALFFFFFLTETGGLRGDTTPPPTNSLILAATLSTQVLDCPTPNNLG